MVFRRLIAGFIIPLILLLAIFPVNAAEPADISNHWAQDYILSMLNNEIMELYPDGSFKPEQAISRGEFTLALAKQMNVIPDRNPQFTDLEDYPEADLINALAKMEIIGGYPDKTFRPEKSITRAETISILIKSLGITDNASTIDLSDTLTFKDLPAGHWALKQIGIAEKLDLIEKGEYFNPDKAVSRAEAAKLISRFAGLASSTGYITDIYPTSRKVSVNHLNGERKVYDFSEDTLVGRNNRLVPLEEILKTDKVFFITDTDNNLKYIKAYGLVTEEDLAVEISSLTGGIFASEEIKELSTGNYDLLIPKLQTTAREQLQSQGLSKEEIDALINTDWDELEELGKTRLAEAIAIQTGLSLDITRSLLNGDWEKVKTYGQIELIQRVVQAILNADLIS